ncbi:Hypothetical_protein [Hexamita inflata]|uniref:Hypothetical_protein n=1 Tax=Hexamita inflata TaxID=28002 RepID=A0ABP1K223_9EUKA
MSLSVQEIHIRSNILDEEFIYPNTIPDLSVTDVSITVLDIILIVVNINFDSLAVFIISLYQNLLELDDEQLDNIFELVVQIYKYCNFTVEDDMYANINAEQLPNLINVGWKFKQLTVTIAFRELSAHKAVYAVEQYYPKIQQFLIYIILFNVPISVMLPILDVANNKFTQRFLRVDPEEYLYKIFNCELDYTFITVPILDQIRMLFKDQTLESEIIEPDYVDYVPICIFKLQQQVYWLYSEYEVLKVQFQTSIKALLIIYVFPNTQDDVKLEKYLVCDIVQISKFYEYTFQLQINSGKENELILKSNSKSAYSASTSQFYKSVTVLSNALIVLLCWINELFMSVKLFEISIYPCYIDISKLLSDVFNSTNPVFITLSKFEEFAISALFNYVQLSKMCLSSEDMFAYKCYIINDILSAILLSVKLNNCCTNYFVWFI